MRIRQTVLVTVLAMVAVLAAGCTGLILEPINRDQVNAVLDMYEQAHLTENANLLGSLVGDRVTIDGVEYTRQEYLESVEAEWARVDYTSYILTERHHTFASDYRDAVVDALRVTRQPGGATTTVEVRFSLQKLAGNWKIVRLDHNP